MNGSRSSIMLAGWLFADCMLGLMIVGLASDSGAPAIAVSAARPTVKPTATPKPKATPPSGVEQHAVVKDFALRGKSDNEIKAAMRLQYASLVKGKRRAAFVLSFGTAAQPGEGVTLAKRANRLLAGSVPAIFSGSARRDFWQAKNGSSPASGVVRVEIYLFNAS